MNNMIRKAVLIPMAFLTLFSLFGCGKPRDERAAEEILKSMQEKYSEEFVLDGIGGSWGTMNNNTLKAIVRPKEDPTLKVPVEITKDFKEMYDLYLNMRVARNEEPKIETLARTYWPDANIEIYNDTKLTYPVENDTSMTYPDFAQRYPMNTQIISVYLDASQYLDGQGNMDQQAEVNKYLEFADVLADHHYINSRVSMVYLTPEAHGRFDEFRQSATSVSNSIHDQEQETNVPLVLTRVGFSMDAEGKLKETRDKINSYFDTWKEKRLNSLEQRGGV